MKEKIALKMDQQFRMVYYIQNHGNVCPIWRLWVIPPQWTGHKRQQPEGERPMIKIIIADDHSVVRQGLKQIVSEVAHMVISDEASNGNELFEKVLKNHYDVIVLDVKMPETNIIDLIKNIKLHKAHIPILILSMYPEEQYAVRVLKAGASGYLTKESAPKELVSAIQKIAHGGKYISPKLAEQLADQLGDHFERPKYEILSDREFQVFCMIASGKSIKSIAEDLYLSDKTVSTYRARVLQKMKMKNNAELTHYAFKQNIVDL
jgi:DNA-binding NarL/FixJ family response regulator